MIKFIFFLILSYKSFSSSLITPGFYEGFDPQSQSKCLIEVSKVTHQQRRKSPIHRIVHIIYNGFQLKLRHTYQYDITDHSILNFNFDRKTMSDLYQIGHRLYAAKIYLSAHKNYTTLEDFKFMDPVNGLFECIGLTKVDTIR